MTRRIGLFGGTFDPVHLGHLVLAEQCYEQAELDVVWFVPAGTPPHKGDLSVSAPKHRMEMLNLAISGTPHFALCAIELERAGLSYTVETLAQLQTLHPSDEFELIVGADMLADFRNWREPERIASLCRLIAVNRGDDVAGVQTLAVQLQNDLQARIRVIEMPAIDISATDIRRRAKAGKSIRFLTPRGVEMYIAANRLYSSDH